MGVAMNFEIECEREDDGRWLAEVPQLPGVLAYGDSANDAMAKAQILVSRAGYADFVFAFHDGEEIGPKMLARIAKHTGIIPNDL